MKEGKEKDGAKAKEKIQSRKIFRKELRKNEERKTEMEVMKISKSSTQERTQGGK